MAPRLSGQTSIFGVVFFVLKSLLGIERQKTRKPRSHARILSNVAYWMRRKPPLNISNTHMCEYLWTFWFPEPPLLLVTWLAKWRVALVFIKILKGAPARAGATCRGYNVLSNSSNETICKQHKQYPKPWEQQRCWLTKTNQNRGFKEVQVNSESSLALSSSSELDVKCNV